MKQIRTIFKNEKEKKAFVLQEDLAFGERILSSVKQLVLNEPVRIMTVSGPSCSGKTTTADLICRALKQSGKNVHVISLDNFFLSRSFLLKRAAEKGTKIDFDSPDTLDFNALTEVTDAAFSGKSVIVPFFNFKTGERDGATDFGIPSEDDVYLFEGIQAVYPAVTALFGRHPYRSIFLSVGEDAVCGDTVFMREEIRFLRRLVRDRLFRETAPEFTFRIWGSVRENEMKNIFPNAGKCDLQLTTYLPYELNMIRDEACACLDTIGAESVYYGYAKDLLRKLEPLPPISSAYLSESSLYHEFLG